MQRAPAGSSFLMTVCAGCATTGLALIVGVTVGRLVLDGRYPALFLMLLFLTVGAGAVLSGVYMGHIRDLLHPDGHRPAGHRHR